MQSENFKATNPARQPCGDLVLKRHCVFKA
jgi:hypothetical protein